MAGQYRFKDDSGNIVAQISASVEGAIAFSGSVVDFTQANNVILGNVQLAGTASNALLLDGFDSQAFAFTSSIHPFTASTNSRLNSIETISASNISRINSLETTSASVDTLNTNQNSRLDSLEAKTGSLASTGSNTFIGTQTITGSLYISSDLIVQGSSSLQNITASAVSIGTNIINLNTANPAIRYAGLSIGDSGSIGSSGSFLYDSVQDEFIFVHRGANSTVTSSVVLMGPQTYDSIGNETYLTTNRIPKGAGNEHLIDSNISDTGTLVTINSVTASFTGSVGIGTTTPTSKLDIYGASGNANPIFKVIGTSAADSFNYAGTILNPSLGSGRNYALFIGKALNTKDSAYIGFNHSGTDGSDSNFVNIGHFNNDYMLNIKGNGFVGIGTTNPTYKFDVLGPTGNTSSVRISATYGGGGLGMLHITSDGAEGGGITFEKSSATAQKWKLGCGSTGALFFYNETSGSQPLTIQTNGNIGIGTASTTASDVRLEVYKAAVTGNWSPRLVVKDQNFASFLGIFNQKAGVFAHTSALDGWADLYVNTVDGGFGAGNNGKVIFGGMCILANGNVGIGVTDPAWKLHIQGTTGTSIQDALMTLKNTAASNTTGILFVNSGNTNSYNDLAGIYAKIQSGNAKGYLGFYTRNSDGSNSEVGERLRISAEGYVGIGLTSPTFRLHVSEVGTTIASGNAISTSTMKGLRIDNTNNSNESVGVWFNTGGSHWSGITGQRTGTGGVEGWATDLRFYTHETSTVDLTYARERMRISADGYVNKPSQPAFKAGRSSSISVGANSTIVFNDTGGNHFNIGGHYNTSNGLFTAPIAGRYIFSTLIIYQDMSAGQAMDDAFYIYKNADLVTYSFRRAEYEGGYTGNGGYYVDHANILLNLAAGDTVSIRNNRALTVHGNTNYTWFYGYMLG